MNTKTGKALYCVMYSKDQISDFFDDYLRLLGRSPPHNPVTGFYGRNLIVEDIYVTDNEAVILRLCGYPITKAGKDIDYSRQNLYANNRNLDEISSVNTR